MNRTPLYTSIESKTLQALINRIPEPIVWISENDQVLAINAQAEKIWELTKEQLLGHTLSYNLSPSHLEGNNFCSAIIEIKKKHILA